MKLFEISYEVCNKVGGIYTVLKTKAPYIVEHYGRENYTMIGFYNKSTIHEFDEKKPDEELNKIFEQLKSNGIIAHYGEWLIKNYPNVILVDVNGLWKEKNKIKTLLWQFYSIDSLFSSYEFEEPMLWSYACGMLIEEFSKIFNTKIVAHFHEWLSAAGMLYLKMKNLPVKTVFTTHATVAGRTLANNGVDLYNKIYSTTPFTIEEARRFGIIDKHTMEIAAANNAHIFSTVSEVTAKEAEYFLQRKPDIILPNGIDIENITMDDIVLMRRENRKIMRKFLNAYFLRYYNMDMSKIRSIFISGRYEIRNKGIDIFIRTLGNLNRKLNKRENLSFDAIIAFLFIPSNIKGENLRVMKNVKIYENIENVVDDELRKIRDEIVEKIINGKLYEKIFSDEFLIACKEICMRFKSLKGQKPPVCAFEINENDKILNLLRQENLENNEDDIVKVIYYPVYLSPRDIFISMDYYNVISTFDIGIFPSYYEPWGYTPLETAKHGVITITTDLAGFGNFVEKRDCKEGIYVIPRKNKNDDEVVEELTKKILEILNLSDDERAKARIRARELATYCDWKILINNYFKAYEMALSK